MSQGMGNMNVAVQHIESKSPAVAGEAGEAIHLDPFSTSFPREGVEPNQSGRPGLSGLFVSWSVRPVDYSTTFTVARQRRVYTGLRRWRFVML